VATGLVGGAAAELSGANKPVASVTTNNSVAPAHAGPDGQMPLQDRAWVEAHRKQLGMPADMPADQFFQEFLAHDLAYKQATKQVANDPKDASKGTHEESNYTPYEQAMLKAWGYQAKPQEVMDPKSGLYAARFNPIVDKNGKGPDGVPISPVVAFRGTADLGGARADADTYIGASQYEPHKAEIAALMNPDHGKVVTTGHSLGGSLAQKAAADNVNSVAGVTTFQSPGIDYADAAKFNLANRDHHIDVAHHYVSSDTVHRAGDQKLGGTFYENKVAGMDGVMSAPGLALKNVMPSHTGYMYYNNGDGNLRDPDSKWAKQGVSHNVTTEEHTSDTVGSRHFHEGMRQGLGALATTGITGYNVAKDIGGGIKNGVKDTISDLGSTAHSTGQGLKNAGSEGWSGVKTAGSGVAQGTSEIAHGHILSGLGQAGTGLMQGTGQVLKGGYDAASSLVHGAAGTVGALGHGALDVGKGVLHAGGDLLKGGEAAAYQVGKSALHLAQVPGELGTWAGEKLVQGGSAAVNATGHALSATGHAIDNGAHWAGDKIKGAWHSLGF
jgi:hypothetical protein